MKKGVSCIFAVLVLSILALSMLLAADNSSNSTSNSSSTSLTGFEKSYSCLKDILAGKDVTKLTQDELSFSLLAMSYDSSTQTKIKNELMVRQDSSKCWPKGACTIRDTAIALLALDSIGKDTKDIQNWLTNQTMSPTDLTWFLQIDTDATTKTKCTITADGSSKTIYVNEDKTLSGTPGSCFTIANNDWWLQINPKCYGKDIQVQCDNSFLIATHFKRKLEDVNWIPATTQTSSPGGTRNISVNSICFKKSGSCNYEGSLWASLALNKKDSSIREKVLPYLMTSASANERLLPSSFLYMITGYNDYFQELTNLQKTQGYWQVTSEQSRRYYDTATALLALNERAEQADTAKEYLIQPDVQGSDGCYNKNIADVAYILYASSPKTPVSTTDTVRSQCADFSTQYGYSCSTSRDCESQGGKVLTNFDCFSGFVCCSISTTQKACLDMGGKKCSSTQECSSGGFSLASDTSYCCLSGDCQDKSSDTLNECEQQGSGYFCSSSCDSANIQNFECSNSGEYCCSSSQAKKSLWWVWVLILLIILLALAIIFRNQLKVWLFKRESGFSKSPLSQESRPPMPPSNQGLMSMPRRILPNPSSRPISPMQRRPFPKDRELDETLRKLKDMSK